MVFKRLFGGSRGDDGGDEARTIEDLIVLERWEEAEQRLKARLGENPDDLHSHLKLAEVYTALRKVDLAVDEYVHVAEEYARDGFYEKGVALLSRARKLLPAHETLPLKIQALQLARRLEHKRAAAVAGVRSSGAGTSEIGNRTLLLERLWHDLAASAVIERLSAGQIRRLFAALEPLRMEIGEVLAVEGKQRDALFLLAQGVVEATVADAAGSRTAVRSFGPRDILGESALFERTPWPATYSVSERAVLWRLDREGLERVLLGNPDPRSLLEILREQRNDREVAIMVRKLRARK